MTRRRSKIEEARTAAGWHQPADAPVCRNCAHFRRDPERCVALHFATLPGAWCPRFVHKIAEAAK